VSCTRDDEYVADLLNFRRRRHYDVTTTTQQKKKAIQFENNAIDEVKAICERKRQRPWGVGQHIIYHQQRQERGDFQTKVFFLKHNTT
jgi:hypothetical protein